MKIKALLFLVMLLSLVAAAQQNALVVQQQFGANGSTAWYPVAGYTNHTLTWSQVGATAVVGCAVQVDSSAVGSGNGTAGGVIVSQDATANGTTTVTSVSVSYARVTVTGCTAGTIKVTYSAVNAAVAKGGGGGGGVTSINSVAGSFTFNGGGVTCTSTTCTFNSSVVPSGIQGEPAVYTSGTAVGASSLYLDVTQGTGADICAKINYMATQASGLGMAILDARGFTGLQACNSNPYHGLNKPFQLLLGNVNIITSVPWWTPQLSNSIIGYKELIGGTAGGTVITACGPIVPSGVTYTNSTCTITTGGATIATFPNSTTQLTFNFQHGPFPAGTYACVLCLGGEGTASPYDGIGWQTDAFGQVVQHVKVDFGGNTSTFGLYSQNLQENSSIDDVTTSNMGYNTGNDKVAGFFFDRAEAPTTNSGPAHFALGHLNVGGGSTVTTNSSSTYGLVVEESDATCIISGGSGSGATCYVQKVVGGVPTLVVGRPGSGYASSAPAWTVYGAPPSYGGTPVSCTGTAAVSSGQVSGFGSTSSCTGFNNGRGATGPESLWMTVQGGANNVMTDCVVLDGFNNAVINYLHCERASSYALQLGTGNNFFSGGSFSNIDSPSTVAGGLIHIEPGSDGSQLFSNLWFTSTTGTPNLIFDETTVASPVTITSAQGIQSGSAKGLQSYNAGGGTVGSGAQYAFATYPAAGTAVSGASGFTTDANGGFHTPGTGPTQFDIQQTSATSCTVSSFTPTAGSTCIIDSSTYGQPMQCVYSGSAWACAIIGQIPTLDQITGAGANVAWNMGNWTLTPAFTGTSQTASPFGLLLDEPTKVHPFVNYYSSPIIGVCSWGTTGTGAGSNPVHYCYGLQDIASAPSPSPSSPSGETLEVIRSTTGPAGPWSTVGPVSNVSFGSLQGGTNTDSTMIAGANFSVNPPATASAGTCSTPVSLGGMNYVSCAITSAQLLSLNGYTSIKSVQLIPGTAGHYYVIQGAVVESQLVTTPYTCPSGVRQIGLGVFLSDSQYDPGLDIDTPLECINFLDQPQSMLYNIPGVGQMSSQSAASAYSGNGIYFGLSGPSTGVLSSTYTYSISDLTEVGTTVTATCLNCPTSGTATVTGTGNTPSGFDYTGTVTFCTVGSAAGFTYTAATSGLGTASQIGTWTGTGDGTVKVDVWWYDFTL